MAVKTYEETLDHLVQESFINGTINGKRVSFANIHFGPVAFIFDKDPQEVKEDLRGKMEQFKEELEAKLACV